MGTSPRVSRGFRRFAVPALALAVIAVLIFPACGTPSGGEKPVIKVGSWLSVAEPERSTYVDGAVVDFETPFTAPPVVVFSQNWQQSAIWPAAAKDATATGFTMTLRNPGTHEAVTDSMSSIFQYLAVLPVSGSTELAAATLAAADGDTVSFALSLDASPAVICGAVSASGAPVYATASDVGPSSFVVHLTDLDGLSASGTLSYIAMVPGSSPLSGTGASLSAGTADLAQGGSAITFSPPLSADPAVVLCSASIAGSNTLSSAWENRAAGCNILVADVNGTYGAMTGGATVHWIAAIK